MATDDACGNCGSIGKEKGTDYVGHICCRLCYANYKLYRKGSRSIETRANPWSVYCKNCRRMVEVNRLEDVKNRDPPPAFAQPRRTFRDPCRMIEMLVGKEDDATTFMIHAPLLISASAYFERALQANFKEGFENRVVLADENPKIFGLLNEYLYNGSIDTTPDGLEDTEVPSQETLYDDYISLWILSDYLQIPSSCNYAIWCLMKTIDVGFQVYQRECPEAVEEYYANAPCDSLLRKFLVDTMVWRSETEIRLQDTAPNALLRDLVEGLSAKCVGSVKSPLVDVRDYYVKPVRDVDVVDASSLSASELASQKAESEVYNTCE